MKRAKGFELEVIANKRPPFGANLQAAVQVCALTVPHCKGSVSLGNESLRRHLTRWNYPWKRAALFTVYTA